MHKITNITIERFRRLHKIDLEMRPLMVLIGRNGAGKTSMMDALTLLSASAAAQFSRSLSDLGGLSDVLTRGSQGPLVLGAQMQVDGYKPLKYSLEIEPKSTSYAISRELLTQAQGHAKPFKHIDSQYENIVYYDPNTKKLTQPDWEHNHYETSLSQVPKMFRQPEELRRVLTSVTQYHVLDVGPRAPIKLPQQMKPANFPGANGEDIVSFLYSLRENDRTRYEIIEDSLRAAFHNFEALNFPPVATGMLTMTWKEHPFKNPIYMHQLSEGTLRFIWLVSLLQSPTLSTITMIDEPEVSLHPELLHLFADLLREASSYTQIIVATHSDRLVRFLKPQEVLVFDINDDGFASATWADSLDLDAWLAEYTLDDVWRMGSMGGR